MTGHPPGSETDPRSHPETGQPVESNKDTEDEKHDDKYWDEANPDHVSSEGLDAEIAAAAKSLFLAPDLLRPGPGLLPFGAKARDRRERRREVDAIASTRRTQLGELLATRRKSRVDRSVGAPRRGHPRTVAALLTALVVAVAAAGWLMSMATGAPSQDPADTATAATNLPTYESEPTTPAIGDHTAPQPAPAVDLTSPEAAAITWMAAWCPIDPHLNLNPDALAAGIRAVMTTDGWAQFTGTPGQTPADAAPDVTASCDRPAARIVSSPPGSDTTVVVLVAATRSTTRTDNTSTAKQFRIERRQYVIRGGDGLWRVDVPAVGG